MTVKGKTDINSSLFQDINYSFSVQTHKKIRSKLLTSRSKGLRICCNSSDVHLKLIATSFQTVLTSVWTVFVSVWTVLAPFERFLHPFERFLPPFERFLHPFKRLLHLFANYNAHSKNKYQHRSNGFNIHSWHTLYNCSRYQNNFSQYYVLTRQALAKESILVEKTISEQKHWRLLSREKIRSCC